MQEAETDQAVNPFVSRTSTPSFAHCIWEALKDRPEGLGVQDIAAVMHTQNLRDTSHLKSAAGQVNTMLHGVHTSFDALCSVLLASSVIYILQSIVSIISVHNRMQVSNVIGRHQEHFAHAADSSRWILS